MERFDYQKSCKISNWGISFDSYLELRYALSIQEEYAFLRSPVSIYYRIRDLQLVSRPHHGVKRYTPDFLIRHKQTLEAFWVEIKPYGYNSSERLDLNRKLAESYIRWKQYDWKYKVVFSNEFKLNEEQHLQFKECLKLRRRAYHTFWLETKNKLRERFIPPVISTAPDNRLIDFVMFGIGSY